MEVDELGHYARRELADGRGLSLWVDPLLYGRARLGVGPSGSLVYDDVYDYDSPGAALAALAAWDGMGEPDGWVRHPASGRRRPGGDPAREYVNW